ncbi:hypothetical protein ACP70R_043567 [Stipagrostis hirtigluma subsp. patula]
MAGETPFRRWKRFLPTFDAIDAAVEASDPAVSRTHEQIRLARGQIVEALRRAPDDGVAEEICLLLDDAMAESLVTLRAAPVTASALASTDLAMAVAALGQHESARIRRLARDVVRGWRASVEGDIARARAAMEALDKLSDVKLPPESLGSVAAHARSCHVPVAAEREVKELSHTTKIAPVVRSSRVDANHDSKTTMKQVKIHESHPCPKQTAPVFAGAGTGRVKAADGSDPLQRKTTQVAGNHCVRKMEDMATSTKITESLPKKMPPFVRRAAAGDLVVGPSPEEKMEATKRKLHEGYQEAADAKRQRKIQVIEAPKMVEQRQRKMHPILRERSRARCGSSTAVSRSLMPSFQRV